MFSIIGFCPTTRTMAAMHIPRWVYWAVAYLLVCQIQALSILDRVLYGEWVGKQGDALNQTVNILQIIIGLALFCRGFKHWSGVRKGSFLYISLAVFLLCSASLVSKFRGKPSGLAFNICF